jgi:outer membrane receptor protein involved in Fe transport
VDVASIPVEFSGVSLMVRGGVRNILDRDYRNHLSTLRGVVTSEPGRNLFVTATIVL